VRSVRRPSGAKIAEKDWALTFYRNRSLDISASGWATFVCAPKLDNKSVRPNQLNDFGLWESWSQGWIRVYNRSSRVETPASHSAACAIVAQSMRKRQ